MTHVAANDKAAEGDEDFSAAGAIEEQIAALLDRLPDIDRAAVLRRLNKTTPRSPTPRAGEVLGAVVSALPRRDNWTVSQIKEAVKKDGTDAKPREIYNAVGYLARRGNIRQVGYGQYIIVDLGVGLVTTEDPGIEVREDGE